MPEDWCDAYLDHYEKFFGSVVEESRVFEAEGMPTFQVLAYDKVFRGCRVFTSLGLTHFADPLDGVAEVYMPVDAGWDAIPKILFHTLLSLVGLNIQIGYGISIGGIEAIDPAFSSKYSKSAVYFANPYGLPRGFEEVPGPNGKVGRMYLTLFLSRQEHTYFLDRGSKHLARMLHSREAGGSV